MLIGRIDPQFEADETGRVLVQRRVGEPKIQYVDPR
jgi:hypothetical protein